MAITLQVGKTDRSETYVSIVSSTSGESGLLFADTTTNDTGGYRGQIRYHHSDDSMNFRTGAEERLRITSQGNMGLGCNPGNSSGYRTLQIGDGSTTGGQLWLKNANNSNFYIWNANGGSGTNIYNQSAIPLIFYTTSIERLRIASNGQVLIGNYATHNAIHGNLEVNGNDGINISNATRTGGPMEYSGD